MDTLSRSLSHLDYYLFLRLSWSRLDWKGINTLLFTYLYSHLFLLALVSHKIWNNKAHTNSTVHFEEYKIKWFMYFNHVGNRRNWFLLKWEIPSFPTVDVNNNHILFFSYTQKREKYFRLEIYSNFNKICVSLLAKYLTWENLINVMYRIKIRCKYIPHLCFVLILYKT